MLGNFRPAETYNGLVVPTSRSGVLKQSNQPVVVDDVGYVRATPYLQYKRWLDLICAVILSVFLAPAIIIVSLLIRLTSRGPAFYSQTRLGRFGRPFVIWKHRTMRHNCERESGARWSTKGDTRITLLGRLLRKTHVDEFPQIINVFKGDMSLVGPRPERPEFFPALQKSVPEYAKRLLVKPGVTGMAQVYLPPDEDLESVRLKQIFDLYYARHIGFWLDIRLLIATPVQAIGIPHFVVRPMLLLPKRSAVEQDHVRTTDSENARVGC